MGTSTPTLLHQPHQGRGPAKSRNPRVHTLFGSVLTSAHSLAKCPHPWEHAQGNPGCQPHQANTSPNGSATSWLPALGILASSTMSQHLSWIPSLQGYRLLPAQAHQGCPMPVCKHGPSGQAWNCAWPSQTLTLARECWEGLEDAQPLLQHRRSASGEPGWLLFPPLQQAHVAGQPSLLHCC